MTIYKMFHIFQKIGFDISCELSPKDNPHEMSSLLSRGGGEEKYFELSSADFACAVVLKVNMSVHVKFLYVQCY